MAFEKVVQVPGDVKTYAINPQIKRYALTDTGFINKPNGTFVMERSLEPNKAVSAAIKLKVVVNQDLSGIKIKTLNPAGTITINIFNLKDCDELVQLYRFYLQDLIDHDILEAKA